MVWFLPALEKDHYRSPQRASVIFIKMMRIFESRLFWPMAVSFLHASEGVMYSPSSNEVR